MRTPRFVRPLRIAVTAAAIATGVLGAAKPAAAHTEFPGAIQEHWGLSCTPQCTLCHVSPQGGGEKWGDYSPGYTVPPRGWGAFPANLIYVNGAGSITDVKTLLPQLDAIRTKDCNNNPAFGQTGPGICDSDGDGMSDYEEILNGRDPNIAGPGNGGDCPKYGCGANIGTLPQNPVDAGHASLAVAALGVALAIGRRVRR